MELLNRTPQTGGLPLTVGDQPGASSREQHHEPSLPLGAICEQCGESFEPCKGSGGKPQKFCSTECRKAAHANVANVPNVVHDAPKVLDVGIASTGVADTPVHETFDWTSDDSLVLQEQRSTAIYFNKAGDLVIRQQAGWNDEGDSFVVICEASIQQFLDRLTDACGLPTSGGPSPRGAV